MSKTGDAPAGKLLKYTSYLFKNPNISEKEFHDHWRNHHARYPLEAFKKHGVVRYTQYHCTEATRNLLTPMVEGRKNNPAAILKMEILPVDAIVQIWYDSQETWQAVAKEPIFGNAIFEDEAYLFDCSRCYATLGWEEDMVVDTQIVMPGDRLSSCQCQCRKCDADCPAK
ncbi:hypothetical protein BT63DRAFT_457968 [Microthyrium microscopicum]|uniref:EthD domain-containing protein n=1 Tax=Microthyrium microscopicum TaxID=703497 RepID=A0A6A6U606_9PEZI|nr:hypothetical protein BT63DRAFT_457968 [Microthyrium microscopicum]